MGLGKIARGGGKLAAALQVGLLLWDVGAAFVARVRGRSGQPGPDDAADIDQAERDPGQRAGGNDDQAQR